jgi:hypothetical protein
MKIKSFRVEETEFLSKYWATSESEEDAREELMKEAEG